MISLICPLICNHSITYPSIDLLLVRCYLNTIVPFLFPVQMSFLNLWDKGGPLWEVEREKAREELKVQLDVLGIKCIFACHLLWAAVVWNDRYSPCLVSPSCSNSRNTVTVVSHIKLYGGSCIQSSDLHSFAVSAQMVV